MSKSKHVNEPRKLKRIQFNVAANSHAENDILDRAEVRLTLNISESTLRNYINLKYLPVSVIAGKSYFLYGDILRMLARFRK